MQVHVTKRDELKNKWVNTKTVDFIKLVEWNLNL